MVFVGGLSNDFQCRGSGLLAAALMGWGVYTVSSLRAVFALKGLGFGDMGSKGPTKGYLGFG